MKDPDSNMCGQSPNNIVTQWIIVLIALLFPTAITFVYFIYLRNNSSSVQQAAYLIGKIFQFGFPVWWTIFVQNKRITLLKPQKHDVGFGIAAGATMFSIMLLLYYWILYPQGYLTVAVEAIRFKVIGFGLNQLWKYVFMGLFYTITHSFLEEYYWRWFVFKRVKKLVPLWVALIVSSLGFMSHHVLLLFFYFGAWSPISIILSLIVFITGIVWAIMYHRSRLLYSPWISHAFVDACIFLIGYFLVSDCF
jgi:membrane protease YdiL (CAAX protease family)